MKVLILSTFESIGGAAIAAKRLMEALVRSGLDVEMLVRDKQTDDSKVISINTSYWCKIWNKILFYWERFIIYLFNKQKRSTLFRVSIANAGHDISSHPLVQEADIIHLHWINQSFLSLGDIESLGKSGKPIVWTMHDMWPCTGICHHARDCQNYYSLCKSCFFLKSDRRDLSTYVFNKKVRLYERMNITFVGCSVWLAQRAQQSYLLRDKQIESIPNPIDVAVFKPAKQRNMRQLLGLPLDKKLLLFGALNVTDERKGVQFLIEALNSFTDLSKIDLVIFGKVKKEIEDMFPVVIHSMGYISNENEIVNIYNAVDLFVTSSLEENLPNTIMEALACGIPCVGFHVGGIPEMIDHKENGYVAKYMDASDLALGIQWILDNKENRDLSNACIRKVHEVYKDSVVALKYKLLYEELYSQNA